MKDSPIDGRQMIEPLPIAKGQKVNDFVDKVFAKSGYNARRLGRHANSTKRCSMKMSQFALRWPVQ